MARENLNDLSAFVAVAQTKSFTKAAAQLGVTQSALSHAVRGLEERLGLRLPARTTRSVAPTHAGERLLNAILPHIEGIQSELSALDLLRDRSAGKVRLTVNEHAATILIYPVVARLASKCPEIGIEIEVTVDNMFADIVAGRFDAGVRLGEQIERDMIAVRIGPEMRMAVVGSAAYFEHHDIPGVPQDLMQHTCIGMRLPTHGACCLGCSTGWAGTNRSGAMPAGIQYLGDGQSCGSGRTRTRVLPGRRGCGRNCRWTFEQSVGRLVRPFPGYHIYYPSRRQSSPAFTMLVDALRYRT